MATSAAVRSGPRPPGALGAAAISIVIPTFREAAAIGATLDHVAGLPGIDEVVVADGGSDDGTAAVARAHPSEPVVVERRGGRAAQLNAGARASRGELLVFLHADSRLPGDAAASLRGSRDGGGNFRLRFSGSGAFPRLLSAVYALQRRAGFYYGDSTIWVRRDVFERLGGFRELPIMDDYDFVRRLEAAVPTACLPGPATTSDRRWRAQGVVRTVATWVLIRWLFVAGVPPDRLARWYRAVR